MSPLRTHHSLFAHLARPTACVLGMVLAMPAAQAQQTGSAERPAPAAAASTEAPAARQSAAGKQQAVITEMADADAKPTSGRTRAPALGPVSRNPLPLKLYAGQVHVMEQAGVTRVAIGNGGLVSATVVADKQIVLLGENTGTTTMYVWLRNGAQVSYEVTVGPHMSKTTNELNQLLMQYPGVSAKSVGDRIVFDGVYSSLDAREKIIKIAEAYPQVLNLIRDDRPNNVAAHPDQMVQLDVKVVEVRRQALDNIGVKWSNLGVTGPTFATSGYFYANTPFRGTNQAAYPTTTSARPFVSYLGLATQITSVLNFLEANGDSLTLAEPRISTVSGGKSKVQVGGEIPIPVSTGFGQISVVYKPYGVILEFKPVIDSSGNVRSSILAEVSQPDRSGGTGEFVAFTTNRTETEVSLRQNETLVISGLIINSRARSKDGIPGVGNVPVVGRLFSTQELTSEQTEMLVIVTPRLHSAAANEAELLSQQEAYQHLNAVKDVIDQKLAR